MTNNDEFWGDQADWPEHADPRPARRSVRAAAFGASVSRWWNDVVGGGAVASRMHGATATRGDHETADDTGHDTDRYIEPGWTDDSVEPVPAEVSDRSVRLGPNAHTGALADFDDDWELDPPASRPGVDPLLARAGGAAIVATLLVPLLLGFGSGGGDRPESSGPAAAVAAASPTTDVAGSVAATTGRGATPAAVPGTETQVAGEPVVPAAPSAPVDVETSSAETGGELSIDGSADDSSIVAGALANDAAERISPPCAMDYDVVTGDFWIRLADAAGVDLAQLLEVNNATTDTPLFPGSSICLPQGARYPAAPPAPAPTTPATPARSSTPTTTAAKPAPAPAPTSPPTTKPPASSLSAAQVQQIIRNVWPDELEDRAIEIARRESNFVPTARNSCCYGVFQIYYSVHRGWLSGIGVTSADQLYDVATNAKAAYTLYQRAGGWGPWT